jgi:hypothetical protein
VQGSWFFCWLRPSRSSSVSAWALASVLQSLSSLRLFCNKRMLLRIMSCLQTSSSFVQDSPSLHALYLCTACTAISAEPLQLSSSTNCHNPCLQTSFSFGARSPPPMPCIFALHVLQSLLSHISLHPLQIAIIRVCK